PPLVDSRGQPLALALRAASPRRGTRELVHRDLWKAQPAPPGPRSPGPAGRRPVCGREPGAPPETRRTPAPAQPERLRPCAETRVDAQNVLLSSILLAVSTNPT